MSNKMMKSTHNITADKLTIISASRLNSEPGRNGLSSSLSIVLYFEISSLNHNTLTVNILHRLRSEYSLFNILYII
ncbi:hypothetical protein DERF_007549 [Dermatophagoides farinae]|uniref:Uncharacterized protein n=1 Tax=Dermatophagoides farinae TaxID=6954 RepID=A0A922HYE2_DERFA|nr:hypothetical protein DERF_007549 [Dermatophagoides farinae]